MLSVVYKDENAPAIALLYCYVKQFGNDALEYDPQLVRNEIERENNVVLADLQSDKLNAAIEVLTSNLFEVNWNVFETCCHLFSNVPADASVVSPLTVEELIKGIAEAHLILHEPLEYAPDVRLYAGKVFHDFGFSRAPTLFPSAIMPKGNKSDDAEKNKALQELFDYHVGYVIKYLEKVAT